jgi:hypothetical protein
MMLRLIICIGIVTALLGAGDAVARDAAPVQLDPGEAPERFCSRVQAALTREDFDTLEATAGRARPLTTRLPGGKLELQVFYESFSKEDCTQYYGYVSDPVAKARIATVEHWLQQKPDSLTAKLANAIMWEQFAWTARGTGYANQISREQWALFAERSRRAAQFMRDVDPTRDAHAYVVLLRLARDFSLRRPQIDAIYHQARQHFPNYLLYYYDYANLILPKWFGAPGEIADFAKSLLSDPGGDIGAMAYSQVAERLAWEFQGRDIYRENGLTWVDVQRGFAVREHQNGLDKWAWIALCYYATQAGDRVAAREAFRHVTHLDYWPNGGQHAFYLEILPWIMERE